jgi:hypothetical protein
MIVIGGWGYSNQKPIMIMKVGIVAAADRIGATEEEL